MIYRGVRREKFCAEIAEKISPRKHEQSLGIGECAACPNGI